MTLLRCIRLELWSQKTRKIMEYESQELGITKEAQKEQSEDTYVKKLSWEEVERLTGNFSEVIDHGGFSIVYLGVSPISSFASAAFKVQDSSERLDRIFRDELNVHLHIQHDNIVKLYGYCDGLDKKVLVFEYIANGTLQEKLHRRGTETGQIIPWNARMMIAFQLAQAIEYLHEKCDLRIIHHDLKSCNILLDDDFNCKLCDFGSAKLGFSSPASLLYPSRKQLIVGSPGYVDPYYLRTGVASKSNDIYSFGVLVLELITGMEATALERDHFRTFASNLTQMVDPNLYGNFNLEEAKVMVSISKHCLNPSLNLRPTVSEILQTMKRSVPSVSFLCK